MRKIFLYRNKETFSVVVTDKDLGYEPEKIFSSVEDAEREVIDHHSKYGYYQLDKDLVSESIYNWETGEDFEEYIIEL